MGVRWYSVVIDARDIHAQARWWADALDWRVVHEADDEVSIVPPHATDDTREFAWREQPIGWTFVPVPEGKQVKNRLHLDLAPGTDDDQVAEVERLVSLGARRMDVGQDEGSVTWVVLADPEGNEFCVLSPRA